MPRFLLLAVALVCLALQSCKATKLRRSGFLSSYENLEQVDSDLYFYRDPRFRKGTYPRVILDPIAVNLQSGDQQRFKDAELQEIAEYANASLTRVLSQHFELVSSPGPGTGRLRLALTDIAKSKPLLNLIPHTRAVGVGRGGAAVEGEYVDARTGEQIFAGIRRSQGKFLSSTGFTALSDIKAAIDVWADGIDERARKWKAED
ncbi:MAG: DUF3313 domain-containing protein [Planctomycetota bacterium]